METLKRLFRHGLATHRRLRRTFDEATRQDIADFITESETAHFGEIAVVVENALTPFQILRGMTPRDRAMEVFSDFHLWDTEHNSGVLLYVLMADQQVEIVADRGIDAHVTAAGWEAICRELEETFREQNFHKGIIAALRRIGDHLHAYCPSHGEQHNEIPNEPVVL